MSAFVFIKEFVGDAYAGPAALFDLPYKLYMVLVLPFLLGEPLPTPTKLVADPLNLSILSGLAVAFTKTPYASLGALGQAASLLAGAQTPILFVLIGAKVKLTGATPAVCLSLLCLRHAACYVYVSIASFGTDAERMTLLLLAQAAVSVVGWGQIARARDAGGRYDVDLAFDVVGYSMPLTMALQTAACLGVLPSTTVMPLLCLAAGGLGWALLRRRCRSRPCPRLRPRRRRRHRPPPPPLWTTTATTTTTRRGGLCGGCEPSCPSAASTRLG